MEHLQTPALHVFLTARADHPREKPFDSYTPYGYTQDQVILKGVTKWKKRRSRLMRCTAAVA